MDPAGLGIGFDRRELWMDGDTARPGLASCGLEAMTESFLFLLVI